MLENSTKSDDDLCKIAVAPYAGAWIETRIDFEELTEVGKVAPYAGAWIETLRAMIAISSDSVAPYAGAWIETLRPLFRLPSRLVAPYAGAWIETMRSDC